MNEDEAIAFIDNLPQHIDADEYHRLQTVRVRPADVDLIVGLDPFSAEYRKCVTDIYHRIAGREFYSATDAEKSGIGTVADIWRASSPFSFRSSKFVGEFLTSWGAIFDALDVKAGDTVLEYGSGSGQILLMLARTGVRTYGVDIDDDSLALVRQQADAMGLDVELENGAFGEGFEGVRFDRILFFEAFHHALNFDDLLLALHDRLVSGGRLVFCGEPIVPSDDTSIPYPWGPRMDFLSLLCIRRYGWMELGFHRDFFLRCLMRAGWLVTCRLAPIFRAITYIAEPMGDVISMGAAFTMPAGWEIGEGELRWTRAETVLLPLPVRRFGIINVSIEFGNYLGEAKTVRIGAGGQERHITIESGKEASITIAGADIVGDLSISAPLSSIASDSRLLGIAVRQVRIERI